MILKKNTLHDCLWAILFAVVSVVVYYMFYEINNGTFVLAILSAIVRSLLLVFVLNKIHKACDDNCYTGAAYLLYSTVIYNSISSIKYSVDYLYTGAIDDLLIRVLGSLYIDFVIVVATNVFSRIHRKNVKRYHIVNRGTNVYIPLFLTYIIVFIYAGLNLSYTIVNSSMLVSGVSRTMRTFVYALTYITYAAIVLNVKKNKNGNISFPCLIPVLLVCVVNAYMTLITGKKNIIIVFAVVIICGLLFAKKINFKIAKFSALASPLALQAIQIFSESTSSRSFFTNLYQLQYHAFRFDLSDLATHISLKFGSIQNPLTIISESISYAVPSVISKNKTTDLLNYKAQLGAVGLNPEFDFNDTFFSMGAQAGGFLGILLVFILITIFFEWYSMKLLNMKSIGSIMFLVLIGYFASCESDWSMFVYQTRDTVIYIVLTWLVFRLFTRIRRGGQR